MDNLTKDEYRTLLLAALPTAADADTLRPESHTLFTPGAHRNALDSDVTVVRGARGVGKTVWYTALQNAQLREVAAENYQISRLRSIDAIAGYGSELRPDDYPGPSTLAHLIKGGATPEDIWTAVVLLGLGVDQLRDAPNWQYRVGWVRENPEERDVVLARADRETGDSSQVKLVLFDALDRLSPDRTTTERLIEGILKVALDLRTRTRHLRAKIFIRHDMFNGIRMQFPDSSKLTANAADLTWSGANLYGLLFHHLGNAKDGISASFRQVTPGWHEAAGRYIPPSDVVGDGKRQQQIFELIAGRYMGTDHRKGRPYTWLANHLIDGIGQVSPRSFLTALRKATEVTSERFARHEFALHWDGIREGVQSASSIRVAEVNEDLPWVATAVGPLEGLQVPMDEEVLVGRWDEANLSTQLENTWGTQDFANEEDVRTGPRNVDDYHGLVAELIELGVMSRRVDGRVDLPDVYRIAFKIGRKGGVPRLRG